MARTNTGNLEDMMCPECSSEGPFHIACTTTALVWDATVGDHEEMTWDEDSDCTCTNCGHAGTVKGFKLRKHVKPYLLGHRVTRDENNGCVYAMYDGTVLIWAMNADGSVEVDEDATGEVDFFGIDDADKDYINRLMRPVHTELQALCMEGIGFVSWNYEQDTDKLYIDCVTRCYCISHAAEEGLFLYDYADHMFELLGLNGGARTSKDTYAHLRDLLEDISIKKGA